MLTLQDTKTMLFIDDTKTETGKSGIVGQNSVSANHEINFARLDRGFYTVFVLGGTD